MAMATRAHHPLCHGKGVLHVLRSEYVAACLLQLASAAKIVRTGVQRQVYRLHKIIFGTRLVNILQVAEFGILHKTNQALRLA